MSKLLMQEFLNSLGIQIGVPFCDNDTGNYIAVRLNERRVVVFPYPRTLNDDCDWCELSDFIDCEITKVLDYHLTDAEKAIVRLDFQDGDEVIANTIDGVFVIQGGEWIIQLDSRMFNFIPEGGSIPIAELKKYL